MTRKQTAQQMVAVAQSYHRGAFHEIRATLTAMHNAAQTGKLARSEQAMLFALAEYGLFYSCFYHQLLRNSHAALCAQQPPE